ncbi:MAG: hypothetical protein KQH79_17450 [Bacteroidetes bacterium]|nr:hypothetical protein [Bacteroidota bacterium]
MEKKLIYEDAKAIEKAIKNRKRLNDLIIEFNSYLSNKGIESKKEHIVNFVSIGIPYIHSLLRKDAKAEIEKLGIKSVSIQDNMLAGIEKQASDFNAILSKIRNQVNQCDGIRIEDLSFENNNPVLTESDIDKIKEYHSIYVSNEHQENLFKLQTDLAKAINKFEKGIEKLGFKSIFTYGEFKRLEDYIQPEPSKGIKPDMKSNVFTSNFTRFGGVTVKPNPYIHK